MKILVTGEAGFVGNHLCEALAKYQATKQVALDNYSTGDTTNHVPNVRYIKGNTWSMLLERILC